MKNLILSLTLVVIASCGGGGGGAGGGPTTFGASSSKEFFSTWTEAGTGYTYAMDAGDFSRWELLYNAGVYVTSGWVNFLILTNLNGGNYVLPTAGQVYFCDFRIRVTGDNTSGGIEINVDNWTNTEHNNACLQLDNTLPDNMNFHGGNYDHLYEISNNIMAIDWFGAGDGGAYGVDYYY